MMSLTAVASGDFPACTTRLRQSRSDTTPAIASFAILLTTDTFRGNTTVSRWLDPEWLAWLAVPLYWVHQFEEYSLPVLGFDYSS
jgi:hypothetical protein